jgi:excisionase family DNA binding protein
MVETTAARRDTEAMPSTFADIERLLTVEDVAELLRVPVSWIYERTRQRSSNRLPGFRLGKYWRFRASDIQAWLETQKRTA